MTNNNNTRDREIKIKIGQLMKICHTGTSQEVEEVFKNSDYIVLFKDAKNNLLNNYLEKHPNQAPLILNKLKLSLNLIAAKEKSLLQKILEKDDINLFNLLITHYGKDAIYNIYQDNKNILTLARKQPSNKIFSYLIDNIPVGILQDAEKKVQPRTNFYSDVSYNSNRVKFEESSINSLGSYVTNSTNHNINLSIIEKTLNRYQKEGIIPNWHFVYAMTHTLKYNSFDINQQFFKPFKEQLLAHPNYLKKSLESIQENMEAGKVISFIYTFKELAQTGEIKVNFPLYGQKSYEKQHPELMEVIYTYPLLLKKEDAFKINKAKHVNIFIQAINQPGELGDFEGKFSYLLLKNSDLEPQKMGVFIESLKKHTELFNVSVLQSFATQLIQRDKPTQNSFDNFSQTLKILSNYENKKNEYEKMFYHLLTTTQNDSNPDHQKNLTHVLNAILDSYPDILYGKGEFSYQHKKTPREYHFVSFAVQSNNPILCQYLLNKIDYKKIDEEYLIDIRRAIFRVSNKEVFQPLYEKFYFEKSISPDIDNAPKKSLKI